MKNLVSYFALLLVGIYGTKLALTGDITLYIHQKYVIFFTAGTSVCIFVGLAGLILSLIKHKKHIDNHEPISITPSVLLSTFPLALFLITGLFLPPKTLSSATASQKIENIKTVTSTTQQNIFISQQPEKKILPSDTVDYSYQDWLYTLDSNPDIASQSGKTVRLTGFVFKHETFDPDVFVVARFMMWHCALDAVPVGFPVKTDLISSYTGDEWVEVTGKLSVMKDHNNEDILFIIPDKITKTEAPENPYLHPY